MEFQPIGTQARPLPTARNVRKEKTFDYGPNGRRGLLAGKQVDVITARGGAYEKGTPTEAFDFQEPHLRHILAVVGLTDVIFVHADRQLGPEANASFAAATAQIGFIVSRQKEQIPDTTGEILEQ